MASTRFYWLGSAALALAALGLSACTSSAGISSAAESSAYSRGASQAQVNKRNAIAFYNQVFNQHDLSAVDQYVVEDYIQHNPQVANGRAAFVDGFRAVFQQMPQSRSTIVRAAADGDLVMLHVHSVPQPGDLGSAVVDIFRFDANGKIVEHWDVIQAVPTSSASGNSMF